MTAELKQEYTRRITQANKAQLIVILYDMTLTYLNDAKEADKNQDLPLYQYQLQNVRKCLDEMTANLHFQYAPAKELQAIYLYMKKAVRKALVEKNAEYLTPVVDNLTKLRDAYEEAAKSDTSAPVMEHTQEVIAGLTYGKDNTISEDLTHESSNRGFRV